MIKYLLLKCIMGLEIASMTRCLILILLYANNLSSADVKIKSVSVTPGLTASLTCKIKESHLSIQKVIWLSPKGILLSIGNQTETTDSRISVALPYRNELRLRIDRVKPADAGVYTCKISTQPPTSYDVELIVKETTTDTGVSDGCTLMKNAHLQTITLVVFLQTL